MTTDNYLQRLIDATYDAQKNNFDKTTIQHFVTYAANSDRSKDFLRRNDEFCYIRVHNDYDYNPAHYDALHDESISNLEYTVMILDEAFQLMHYDDDFQEMLDEDLSAEDTFVVTVDQLYSDDEDFMCVFQRDDRYYQLLRLTETFKIIRTHA